MTVWAVYIYLVLEGRERPLRSIIEKAHLSSSVKPDTYDLALRSELLYLHYYGDSQSLPYISSFQLGCSNMIWPESVMQLASRMENLTEFIGDFSDFESHMSSVRRNHRKGIFVKLLKHSYI